VLSQDFILPAVWFRVSVRTKGSKLAITHMIAYVLLRLSLSVLLVFGEFSNVLKCISVLLQNLYYW